MDASAEVGPSARVSRTDPTDGLHRSRHVRPQLEGAATCQWRGDPGIGTRDTQSLLIEFQLAHDLRRHPTDVERRIRLFLTLHHQHALARTREGVRRDQAIRTRADDDRVVTHRPFFKTVIAPRRPDAPMIPPPGCVPEPH